MKESDVINWLLDEAEAVLSSTQLVSLSSASKHVDVADSHDGETYPFVGVKQISNTPAQTGLGNAELVVDDLTYDDSGVLTAITYKREPTLRVNAIPTTDDDPALRDDLQTELEDHFSLLARQDGLAADMATLRVETATPQNRTDDFVWADGVPVEIDYERYLVDDDPTVADTVNVDIDVGDHDADVSEPSDADAHDATF